MRNLYRFKVIQLGEKGGRSGSYSQNEAEKRQIRNNVVPPTSLHHLFVFFDQIFPGDLVSIKIFDRFRVLRQELSHSVECHGCEYAYKQNSKGKKTAKQILTRVST